MSPNHLFLQLVLEVPLPLGPILVVAVCVFVNWSLLSFFMIWLNQYYPTFIIDCYLIVYLTFALFMELFICVILFLTWKIKTGSHKNPQNHDYCQNNKFLSTNWLQGVTAEDNTQTTFYAWSCRAGTFKEHLSPRPSVYEMQRYSEGFQTIKTNAKLASNPWSTIFFHCYCLKNMLGHWGISLVEVINKFLILLKAYCIRWNLTLFRWPIIQRPKHPEI